MLVLKQRKVWLNCLALSPSGEELAVAAGSGVVQVWDLRANKLRQALSTGTLNNSGVFWTPGGSHVCTLNVYGIHEMDLATGKEVAAWRPNQHYLQVMAATGDGSRVVVALDWSLNLAAARLPGWQQEWSVDHLHGACVTALAFAPDQRLLAVGCNGQVCLFDTHTRRVQAWLPEKPSSIVKAVAFSPDGGKLVWCAGSHVRLWQLDPARETRHHHFGRTHFLGVSWHPSGAFFATANGDGKVDFWDGETGERRTSFDWGVGKLNDVIFDAAGDRAFCCSNTGQVVIWDVDR